MTNSTLLVTILGLIVSGMVVLNFDTTDISNLIQQYTTSDSSVELEEDFLKNQFGSFISTYRKSYTNSVEYEKRYQIFKDNYKLIEEHNLKKDVLGYTLGMNSFGDLTQEEFKLTFLQCNFLKNTTASTPQTENPMKTFLQDTPTDKAIREFTLPSWVDWRQKGAVSPVSHHGSCGSCWAFSAIAAIEGANFVARQRTEQLSAQQLIDCVGRGRGGHGCSGGLMHGAFEYAMSTDLCTEQQYPHRGREGRCVDFVACSTDHIVANYYNVTEGSRFDLYTAIAQQPVSVGVDASGEAWQFYKSGILSSGCGEELNHAVAAVGYSVETFWWFFRNNYIIVKNSWGTDWGMNGFMHISSNMETGKGMCGIYQYANYPVMTKL